MKRLSVCLALTAALIGGPSLAEQRHIPRSQLEQMFFDIRGQTPWDINGNMLWGYFFTSSDRDELEKLSTKLQADGYRVVDIRKLEKTSAWQLHVEQVETHSVDTLFERNTQLEGLAGQFKTVAYDGMDVGPASAVGGSQ